MSVQLTENGNHEKKSQNKEMLKKTTKNGNVEKKTTENGNVEENNWKSKCRKEILIWENTLESVKLHPFI